MIDELLKFSKRATKDLDRGATAIEYVIAVSILLGVFIMTAAVVGQAIRTRSASSGAVAGNFAPCGGEGGHLTGTECQ